jgi:hypothetical protein
MINIIFTDGNEEINFFAITKKHTNPHAYEDEQELVVSLLSIGLQKYTAGIRILKVGTSTDDSHNSIDEFFDAAFFGISKNYNSIIVEIFFIKIQILF